ncbi:MAG: hypothetical protein AAGF53_14980 [Pseudomonadota bacterium]
MSMSDPVSSTEIEDVLSSVKRLISVDSRTQKSDRSTPQVAEKPVDERSDGVSGHHDKPNFEKFVLKKAYLVDEDQSAAEMKEILHEDLDREESAGDSLELSQWQIEPDADHAEDNVQEAETELQASTEEESQAEIDEAHFEDVSDLPTGVRNETAYSDPDVMFRHMTGLGGAASHSSEDDEAQTQSENFPESLSLEARIAEVEAVVAARDDQWEPDTGDQDEYAGSDIHSIPWQDAPSEILEDQDEAAAVSEGDASAQEEAKTQTDNDLESASKDESAQADVSKSYDAVPDENETSESLETPQPNSETGSAGSTQTWYAEDLAIDEDALRDLVSDIVRRELQGALGERITRNVRKLVRREIHRAMLHRDID